MAFRERRGNVVVISRTSTESSADSPYKTSTHLPLVDCLVTSPYGFQSESLFRFLQLILISTLLACSFGTPASHRCPFVRAECEGTGDLNVEEQVSYYTGMLRFNSYIYCSVNEQ